MRAGSGRVERGRWRRGAGGGFHGAGKHPVALGPRGVQLLPAALADVVLEPAIDPGDPLVGLAGALVVVRLRLQPLTVMGLQCIVRLDSPMN